MENSMEVPWKTKNKTTIWLSSTPGHVPWENHNLKTHMYPSVHWWWFLRRSTQIPKAQHIKYKIDVFIKNKNLFYKRMNTQAIDWENIFAKHIFDKGLILKVDKELLQLSREKKIQLKKWADDLNRYFFPKKTCRWTTGTWKDTQHY